MKKIAIGVGVIAVLAAFLSAQKPAEPEQVSEKTSEAVFTASEVAAHNSREDCYAIISGSVYNLTNWIGSHPGGSEAILGLCGRDGTEAFMGQHGESQQPKQALAQFFIGSLKK